MTRDEALDELYGAALDEFTAERKRLAKKLDGDDAKDIGALRKPNVAAWVLNQLARRERDTLSRVAGADRPDAALPFGFSQHCNGVCSATKFVCIDRLQILQLEPDIGKFRSQIEPHQWRPDNGAANTVARLANLL